jgi:serine/threonine protein kinase
VTFEPDDAKSLFLQASELPPIERKAFLDRACEGQPELRVRVESLLRSFDDPGSFMARPVSDELGATRIHLDSKERTNADVGDLNFLEPCETPGRMGKLDAYEIMEVIGRGGMGVVLKALDTKLQRIVAIKVLAPQMATNSMAVKRFLREARAAAAVSHDHVITIFAVEEDERHPYLVMECIVGQSLQQKIDRSSPFRLNETLRIGMQIASGLAAAHKQGLVHRDIKPANILLENGVERVKITDFGLARAIDDVGMTQTGQIAGTPQYMSPEQAMGERVDARSDLFSLGSVLYSMCTGRPAFRADTAVAVLRRVCDDTPRPIREINPEVPDWLVGIIDRLLEKRPQDRFQTASEVAELLNNCLAWQRQPDGVRPPALPQPIRRPSPSKRPLRILSLAMILIAMASLFLIVPALHLLTLRRYVESRETIPESASAIPHEQTQADRPTPVGDKVASDEAPGAEVSMTVGIPMLSNPLTEDEVRKSQSEWSHKFGVPLDHTNSLGMSLRLIPPGEFTMGNSFDEVAFLLNEFKQHGWDEYKAFAVRSSAPRHRVGLSMPFYIGQFEVSVAQFEKFVEDAKYVSTLENLDPPRFQWRQFVTDEDHGRQPVCGVSWDDANAFCRWLSDREGVHYDLPTEAQWEYACRAGNDGRWCFGNEVSQLEKYAVYQQQQQLNPSLIGTKHPNAFGLYDLHGNVEEWCFDLHQVDFYKSSPAVDPVCDGVPADPASGRVIRGGGWRSAGWQTRSTTRMYDFPAIPTNPRGFRVVITGDLVRLRKSMEVPAEEVRN